MTLIINTRDVAEADRAEMVREAIATAIVPVEISWPVGGVAAHGMITDLGELTVADSLILQRQADPRRHGESAEPSAVRTDTRGSAGGASPARPPAPPTLFIWRSAKPRARSRFWMVVTTGVVERRCDIIVVTDRYSRLSEQIQGDGATPDPCRAELSLRDALLPA